MLCPRDLSGKPPKPLRPLGIGFFYCPIGSVNDPPEGPSFTGFLGFAGLNNVCMTGNYWGCPESLPHWGSQNGGGEGITEVKKICPPYGGGLGSPGGVGSSASNLPVFFLVLEMDMFHGMFHMRATRWGYWGIMGPQDASYPPKGYRRGYGGHKKTP